MRIADLTFRQRFFAIGAVALGVVLLRRRPGYQPAWRMPLVPVAPLLFVIALIVNVGMWLERFVIVITSLHADYLPSSWGMYYPTIWDIMTFIGTLGLFVTLLFLFIRFLPVISIFEMRTLVPEAELNEGGHH